jgi:hypothetical protein
MGARGRKSAAELTVFPGGKAGPKPAAPDYLTSEEAEVWVRTVAGEPDDFFATDAVRQILADYCRHVVTANRLSATIAAAMGDKKGKEPTSLRDLDLYLKMRDRETRAIGDKATKLRLTNQARYRADDAGLNGGRSAPRPSKPWNDPLDED